MSGKGSSGPKPPEVRSPWTASLRQAPLAEREGYYASPIRGRGFHRSPSTSCGPAWSFLHGVPRAGAVPKAALKTPSGALPDFQERQKRRFWGTGIFRRGPDGVFGTLGFLAALQTASAVHLDFQTSSRRRLRSIWNFRRAKNGVFRAFGISAGSQTAFLALLKRRQGLMGRLKEPGLFKRARDGVCRPSGNAGGLNPALGGPLFVWQ